MNTLREGDGLVRDAPAAPVRRARRQRDLLQDFAFLRHFSYGCKQVFSASAGRSPARPGLFLDPFYSPGTDFIAIGNTYITELIGRDRAGRPIDAHAQVYDQIYHSFYESTLALYRTSTRCSATPR